MANKSKRGRPFNEIEEQLRKRIANQGLPLPENDVRFDGLDHFPSVDTVRHKCKVNGCKSRVITKFKKCTVHLCITQKKTASKNFIIKNSNPIKMILFILCVL